MCVNERQMHYGAVLAKILDGDPDAVRLIERHKSEKEIYQVDGLMDNVDSVHFYLKHSATPREMKKTGGHCWGFSFSKAHIQRLRELLERPGLTYTTLVCGRKSVERGAPPIQICLIFEDELLDLLDLNTNDHGNIRVEYQRGKQLRVFGSSRIAEPLLIPANRLDTMTSHHSVA